MAGKPWDPVELATYVVQGFSAEEIAQHYDVASSTIRRRKQSAEYFRALRDVQREMYAEEIAAAASDVRIALKGLRHTATTSEDPHARNNACRELNVDGLRRMNLVEDKAGADVEEKGPSIVERMKTALRPKPLERK